MSEHKRMDRICIIGLVLTVLLTVLFINGEKLGITVIKDEDAEQYSSSAYFTQNDRDADWNENAYTTYVTLNGDDGKISGNGAYFLNGDLVISNAGWFVLSGSLEGHKVIIDAYNSSKVWVKLNGVSITCDDDACFRVEQADKVFLTLAKGTENSFTSGKEYCQQALDDQTGGVIFSHDDLTINGAGTLRITAGYKHGLDINDSLVITGGEISILAPQDGIHVNDSFRLMDAAVNIAAEDDGIHSDGEVYIESGTIDISSCYEGIEGGTIDIAGGNISIHATDDGINANAKEASCEECYIRICGGCTTIVNETGRDADGLDSNGNIYIDGGEIYVSMSGEGGNCAIDFNTESGGTCIVNGGSMIACGSGSMAESFSASSTQCAVLYNLENSVSAGNEVRVLSESGDEILSFKPQCAFSSVAFTSADFKIGESYTLLLGTEEKEITLDSTSVTIGQGGGMGFFQTPGAQAQTGNMPMPHRTDSTQIQDEAKMPPEGFQGRMSDGNFEENRPMRPEFAEGGQNLPEFSEAHAPRQNAETDDTQATQGQYIYDFDHNTLWLLGASILLIGIAILFAKLYKKHK